jgi:thiamine pyrophosphate-dependent acetolactate synthase large subunit-like protein
VAGVPDKFAPQAKFIAQVDIDPAEIGKVKAVDWQHVGPLAAALDIPIDTTFSRGQEAELAQRAAEQAGPTLICWQHESIPAIGAAFAPASPTPPISWPDEVYDRVWVFTAGSGGWRFDDVPQMLLPGDTK